MVDRPRYDLPTKILRRDHEGPRCVVASVIPSSSTGAIAGTDSTDEVQIDEPRTPEDEEVCFHEGGVLFAEDVESQMAILPEVPTTTDEVTIEDIQVGDPETNTPEEIDRLRQIIWRQRHLLIGKGNALPPAAIGAVCDIDVGGAAPIAQRVRRVAPQFREKLSDLIKSLLSAKMIEPSTSPWASPIVIIIKKNGVDIRLCIDYRLVNSLTRLMVYPMPLINDLLEDLDKVLWYCCLDMASGFWVVSMTERARKISAFVTPFGLFEWTRMPFGLKNAPQIYQRLIDNALYGYLRISPDRDHTEPTDVFEKGEPEANPGPSVLGRRSYIDDILITADTWDSICEKVEALLDACERWNLSISVGKSFWGHRKVEYLGHRVSADGLEANPKDLESLEKLPFPKTLRSMQSFLGSLNYYSRFIEDFAVYAAILYELREVDFYEMHHGKHEDRAAESDDRWTRARTAFDLLKAKLATTPILRHFDSDRQPVIVVYANKWAISAALVQEHDGIYWPVIFTSRTLKSNELNYGIVDKEVLALLRILDVCYTLLTNRSIKVLSRYSTLAWLLNASGFQGRLGRWAALLSEWTLEIRKCLKGEDEILGAIAASITPRPEVDEALIAIAPVKEPKRTIAMAPPTVELDEELLVPNIADFC
uniref:Reverse transcriptase domain-containing protein n=1 Tax=Phytophthora ramorum TaxID=164328 RepID=H3H7Z8_PHYRM